MKVFSKVFRSLTRTTAISYSMVSSNGAFLSAKA